MGDGTTPDGFRRGMLPRDAAEAADLEVEHHLAELVDRLVAGGTPEDDARREAERLFGSPRGYRARLERDERARRTTMRRRDVLRVLWGGCAGALRTVRRSPGFAIGVVLTLALGIGANATMFGVLDRLLFQPPAHVTEPDDVRRIMLERPFMGELHRGSSLTHPDFMDLKAVSAFSAVAAWSGPREYTVGRGRDATRARMVMASWDLFPLLGAHAYRGRLFAEDDDRADAELTAVLGYEYRRRAYGASPDAIGRTIELSGKHFTVVGVAPQGFTGVGLSSVDVWTPLVAAGVALNGDSWIANRGWYWMSTVARLAPGTDAAVAEDEATTVHRNARAPEIERDRYSADATIALDPLIAARGPEASGESRIARWLGGVSLMVLLIACANVANLLLARGTRRRRELAVRLALGIGRGRLVAMMVIESLVLAIAGACVALLLPLWGGGFIRSALLPGVLFPGSAVGVRVAIFSLATAAMAGVLAGLGPALQATRADVAGDLSMGAGSGSGRRSRLRAGLTVAQAALSVVLLVGAGLFVRSVGRVRDLDLGLDVDRLALATLEFGRVGFWPGVRTDGDSEAGVDLDHNEIYGRSMERLASVPGVVSVAGTSSPFQWSFATELEVPGLDSIPNLTGGGPYFHDVTPDYLSTVGLRVTRGRDLADTDGRSAPRVAVVSETMARTLWPDADPLGRCLMVGDENGPGTECTTVVGVVEDASRGSLEEDPHMAYYMPIAQREGRSINAMYVRTAGDPTEVAAHIAPILRDIDPGVRFATVRPLRDDLEPQSRSWTLGAAMFSVFGLLALVVAAVGLYGVLAFDVAQRTRELGIRTALGAERGRLMKAVLSSGMGLAGAGVALGLLVAFVAGPFAADLLFHVSPRDPLVLSVVGAVLLAVALVASVVPGLRATRVDPMAALRTE